jgi:hypothetical protein
MGLYLLQYVLALSVIGDYVPIQSFSTQQECMKAREEYIKVNNDLTAVFRVYVIMK